MRSHYSVAVLVFVTHTLLTACVTGKPITPEIVDAPDAGAAYDAALRAVVNEGYTVATKDREAGVIQTDWLGQASTGAQVATMLAEGPRAQAPTAQIRVLIT